MNLKKVEKNVHTILEEIGEDTKREGLIKTPERVAKAYEYLTSGYHQDIETVLNGAIFEEKYDEMVIVKDIDFFSMCEHHMLPFYGKVHVAYIPNGKIVGLSKIPRIVDVFARRLQVQERMTQEIAQTIQEYLNPEGVGVVAEAYHMCMMMRGVEKQNSYTLTSAMHGEFKKDARTRGEFLDLISHKKDLSVGKKNAVWITGASSGIGKSLSIKFAENNFNVIASARRIEPIQQTITANNFTSEFIPLQNDVSNYADLSKKINELKKKYNISCLINNAGITSFKPFVENTKEEIDQIINVNLLGSIYTTQIVLPEMIKNNNGTIINILSVAAKTVFTNSSIYASSKAGLDYFAKVLREEVRSHHIRIINVFPGATSTEIWPKESLNKFSDKMMKPESLADLIFDVYKTDPSLSLEELVVRPITGDL